MILDSMNGSLQTNQTKKNSWTLRHQSPGAKTTRNNEILISRDNNAMHAKPDLHVVLEWKIAGSGSVIADVITLIENWHVES